MIILKQNVIQGRRTITGIIEIMVIHHYIYEKRIEWINLYTNTNKELLIDITLFHKKMEMFPCIRIYSRPKCDNPRYIL